MHNGFSWLGRAFENLIFPRRAVCMGCGDMTGCDRDDLCEDCHARLARNWIGVRKPSGKIDIDGAAFAYRYAGPAGGLVRSLKYRGAWVLAEWMGGEIARAAELLRMEETCIVAAVPMHPRRMRLRGRNHAEQLARSAAEKLGLEYIDLLTRTRNAPQQARLSREERIRNLRGAFAVKQEYLDLTRGAEVLIIDDVLTIGSTAASCAEALRAAGAHRVYFAAFAYGERKKDG